MLLDLKEVSQILNASYTGESIAIESISTDTRTISAGALFIALRGPNFDGHQFINTAAEQGAVAALVDHVVVGATIPCVKVSDTLQALATLAHAYIKKFKLPTVAVTGSCGKTTVKEMIASILAQQGQVLATQGNLNNDIGLPLTIFNLQKHHNFAVFEMGANHLGDIGRLVKLVEPNVALITNVAPAHIEGFGSIDGVAKTKSEIYDGLSDEGVAVINNDDDYAQQWRVQNSHRHTLTFAMKNKADIMAKILETDGCGLILFDLKTPVGDARLKLNVPGMHNVMNALAATAAALALKIDLAVIQSGLQKFAGVKGRMQSFVGQGGIKLIDDTYNANPKSVVAALQVLRGFSGQRIFVMGDMGELGADALQYHFDMGLKAKEYGIDNLYTYGTMSEQASLAFGKTSQHFTDQQDLIKYLKQMTTNNNTSTVMLIKGSRFTRMERVVQALQSEGN